MGGRPVPTWPLPRAQEQGHFGNWTGKRIKPQAPNAARGALPPLAGGAPHGAGASASAPGLPAPGTAGGSQAGTRAAIPSAPARAACRCGSLVRPGRSTASRAPGTGGGDPAAGARQRPRSPATWPPGAGARAPGLAEAPAQPPGTPS